MSVPPLRTALFQFALGVCVLLAPACGAPVEEAGRQTRAELSGYTATSSYADVVSFMEWAATASPHIEGTTFGRTSEDRPLPLAIVSRDGLATAQEVRESGTTVVYLQGNIHGGEVPGKEALQMLLREVVAGEHQELLENLTLLVAPIYNADGNERVALDNRRRQNGPVEGMGQRPNAEGYDLNRDHTKLDSPEARSVARLFSEFDPHLAVDLHTTNGTRHGYHLTYSPPLHPNTPDEIDDLLRNELLPWVTDRIREEHGWDFYYYGNASPRDGEPGWYTFDHRPRFNNNYIGLRNRFAILGEAYAYATFEDRVMGTLWFVEEILDWVDHHAPRIRDITEELDRTPIAGRSLALRASHSRSEAPVDILMGEVEELTHPVTGEPVLNRLDVQRVEPMFEYGSFDATLTETAPAGYVIPPSLSEIVLRLRAHGLRLEAMTEGPVEGEVFHIAGVETSERPFQGHHEQMLSGEWRAGSVEVPDGALWLPTDQPLGRLAFTLLEPMSDDGFANWGFLAESIAPGATYPITRVAAAP